MHKNTAYLLCGSLFILNFFLFKNTNYDYRSFVWFTLFANLISALFLTLVAVIYSVVIWEKKESIIQIIKSLLSLIPIVIVHFFAAIFLSFFARWDEFGLLTQENRIRKEISGINAVNVLVTYLPIYFSYFLCKISLLAGPRSSLFDGFGLVRDAILCVVASMLIPLFTLKLSESGSVDFNLASFFGISLILFIPWPLFFDRDAHAHRADKVPLHQATKAFPMEIWEKGPKGWGFLVMLFGLIFVSVSFATLRIPNADTWLNSLVSFLFFLPFFTFGVGFLTIGINMQWAQKQTVITPQMVTTRVRIFIPWLKIIDWERALIDYQMPTKNIKNSSGRSNSSAQTTYEIKLNLKQQKPKNRKIDFELDRNVTLYKAYHGDNLDSELNDYKRIFKGVIEE